SDDDDKRYRQAEEVAIWRQKDPIQRYAKYLRESATLTDPVEKEITERVDQQVDEATEYAEQAPDPTQDDLMTFVYKQGTVSWCHRRPSSRPVGRGWMRRWPATHPSSSSARTWVSVAASSW